MLQRPMPQHPPNNQTKKPDSGSSMSVSDKLVYIGKYGQLEEIDLHTGEVTKKYLSPEELLDYTVVEEKGRVTFVPTKEYQSVAKYTTAVGEMFAFRLLSGRGVMDVCKELEISYHTYCKWKRQYEEFRDFVENARRDKAEVYFDKIAATVEATAADEDEIALARLKVDAYKHIAGVSDPRRFGPKQQIDAKIAVARLVVDTGIRRDGGASEAESGVYAEISGRQEQIAASEVANAPARIRKPEGSQLSELEKDGLVLEVKLNE